MIPFRQMLEAMDLQLQIKAENRVRSCICIVSDIPDNKAGLGSVAAAKPGCRAVSHYPGIIKTPISKVVVDINEYRKKEMILATACGPLGGKVMRSNRNMRLEPMNPYERRIIHSELQKWTVCIRCRKDRNPIAVLSFASTEIDKHKNTRRLVRVFSLWRQNGTHDCSGSNIYGHGRDRHGALVGRKAIETAQKAFSPAKKDEPLVHRLMRYGHILDADGSVIDEVMISFMQAPNTHTKEDMAEVYSWRSNALTRVYERVLSGRPTRRARGIYQTGVFERQDRSDARRSRA